MRTSPEGSRLHHLLGQARSWMFSATLLNLVASSATFAAALARLSPQVYPGCPIPPRIYSHVYHVSTSAADHTLSAETTISLTKALSVARGGDVLYLGGGNYGSVSLSGTNATFITIAAEPGQAPVFSQLQIGRPRAASGWQIIGLKIVGPSSAGLAHNGWAFNPPNVGVVNSENIIVRNNIVGTVDGTYKWQQEIQGQEPAQPLASGIGVENSSCVALIQNDIKNVFNGITIGGDQKGLNGKMLLVAENRIDGFAGDGIDHYASRIWISHNSIINGHDICKDVCVHTDGIQGWNWHDAAGIVNSDVVIDGNSILAQTDRTALYPADDLHGITIFDGKWDGVDIINNVVVTPAWHGISIYGGTRIHVLNNTVVSTDSKRAAWIMLNHQKGTNSEDLTQDVVRNNVASAFLNGQGGHSPVAGVAQDHNIVLRNPVRTFSVFDVVSSRYDLHPSNHSNLIGAGAVAEAPKVDIEGRTRTGPATVGAYGAPD